MDFESWITSEYGDDVFECFIQLRAEQPERDPHDLLDDALEKVYPDEARRRVAAVKEPFRSDLLFVDQQEK